MKTLKVIGAGVRGASHLTLESMQQLSKVKKILWLGTIEGLSELIEQNNWRAEDITHYYQDKALDSDNYRDIKLKVMGELEEFKNVALVVLGHPRLGVSIVQEFQAETTAHGFQLDVMPGISSFDTMFNDLAIDPIEEGSCLVDANRLILFDYQMDPCLNYFIYHVCSIGNSYTDYESPSIRNSVQFLKQKLLKHYHVEHEIFIVSSDNTQENKPIKMVGTLGFIEGLLRAVTFDSSLYIPALSPKSTQVNLEFYRYLTRQNDMDVNCEQSSRYNS